MSSPNPRSFAPRLALVLVMLVAAGLRLWNLAGHDFGNIYYAAAVRSMAESWGACFYAAFDPAGVVTLDKPPAAFWVQVLSVKVLGYSGLALHLPQALIGVANVLLVYLLARRTAGAWAGVAAAAVMGVFPAVIAADRSNLPDTFLLFVSLLAALVLVRAVDTGRLVWLLAAAVLVGVGFTTKMIVAWMILPALGLAYLVCGPRPVAVRLLHLAIAGAAVSVASLAWPTLVDLTPADSRPYIGGTVRNSAVERALGGFGLDRLIGKGRPGGAPGGARPPGPPMGPMGSPPGGPPGPPPGPGFRGPAGGPSRHLTGHGGMPSVLRLGNRDLAGHGSWLLPFAILGAATAVRVGGSPRSSARAASLVLWGTWLVTFAVVFSAASGPIHPYYLNMLGPPIAILIAIGLAAMCTEPGSGNERVSEPGSVGERNSKRGNASTSMEVDATSAPPVDGSRSLTLRGPESRSLTLRGSELLAARLGRAIAAVALTAAVQVLILGHTPECGRWLVPAILTGSAAGVAILAVAWRRASSAAAAAGLTVALVALLACPAIWSWTLVAAGGGRMVPIADPQLLEAPRDPEETMRNRAAVRALVDYLRRGAGRANFLVASSDIHLVAPLIIETGARAVAWGGFQGSDPAITLDEFTALVERGELRYALLPRSAGPGRMAPPRAGGPIANWVRERGVEVPTAAWLPRELAAGRPRDVNMMAGDTSGMLRNLYRTDTTALYDCAPRASD